jgi:hypothetical protein
LALNLKHKLSLGLETASIGVELILQTLLGLRPLNAGTLLSTADFQIFQTPSSCGPEFFILNILICVYLPPVGFVSLANTN